MAPSVAVISDEQVAAVEKTIKEAVRKEGQSKQGDVTITRGFIWNQHKDRACLKLYDQHAWFGAPTNPPYFEEIPWLEELPSRTWFAHEGPLPSGCKAGLVYTDGEDSTARKWLVAFDSVNRKVYVEAGPIGATDWNVVEVKLDNSSRYVNYEDPVFGGKAHAQITSNNVGTTLISIFKN